jgi:perosamine synthetase
MIRLCEPTFTAGDRQRIEQVLQTGQMIQGVFVAEFERLASAWLDCPILACSSGTAALHLAIMALDLAPGDEVVVPAFTWPSTAHVIVQCGATPVFVDVDPDSLCVTVEAVEKAITPRTRALLPVHLFGSTAPMNALMALAAAHGIAVVEDAACAIGSRNDDGRWTGTSGTIGCFSLHPRKTITTGEGGLLAIRDPALLERMKRLRNHGMERTAEGFMTFLDPGLNYRLTEMGGALGIGQMEQLDAILARRRELRAAWLDALTDVPVHIPEGMRRESTAVQSFVVDLNADGEPIDATHQRRMRIMAALREAGVETTIGTYCLTDQPVYAAHAHGGPEAFAGSRRLARSLLTLPLHHRMNDADVPVAAQALAAALRAFPASSGPA